jgi:hypothetical protein
MAQVDPRQLLAAAMAGGGAGGAPQDSMPIPGAASPAGGTAAGPQGGMQDALPGGLAGEQPPGTENTGVMSTAALQNQMGVGTNPTDASGQTQQLIAAIQDPQTPPDQKAQLQAQLQLAALRALTAGPQGAVGAGSPGR